MSMARRRSCPLPTIAPLLPPPLPLLSPTSSSIHTTTSSTTSATTIFTRRYAAQEGRTAVALALLRAGASPAAEDADGATPTQVAEEWQQVGILRAMTLGPDAAVLLDDQRGTLSSLPVPLQPTVEGT